MFDFNDSLDLRSLTTAKDKITSCQNLLGNTRSLSNEDLKKINTAIAAAEKAAANLYQAVCLARNGGESGNYSFIVSVGH